MIGEMILTMKMTGTRVIGIGTTRTGVTGTTLLGLITVTGTGTTKTGVTGKIQLMETGTTGMTTGMTTGTMILKMDQEVLLQVLKM